MSDDAKLPRYKKRHIGEHRLRPESLMMSYGYDPALSRGRAQVPDLPDLHLRVRECRGGKGLLRDRLRAARARARPSTSASSTAVSTTPISRSSRIVSRCGTRPKPPPCSGAAWRRSHRPVGLSAAGRRGAAQRAAVRRDRLSASTTSCPTSVSGLSPFPPDADLRCRTGHPRGRRRGSAEVVLIETPANPDERSRRHPRCDGDPGPFAGA